MSGLFHAVSAKTAGSHMALCERNSGAESARELFKHFKDSSSRAVCNEKFFVWLGVAVFL